MTNTELTALDYPFNLLNAVFGGDLDEDVPTDLDATLAYVLATLTEREQTVISLRFKEGLSLRSVGKQLGVVSERVRQIEAKALRKLRHPSRSKLLRYGVRGWIIGVENGFFADSLSAAVNDLEILVRVFTAMDGVKEAMEEVRDETPPLELFDYSLDYLDLTVRSYNALRMKGIKTVGDLMKMSERDVRSIRNLGAKSFEEIVRQLDKKGLKLKN